MPIPHFRGAIVDGEGRPTRLFDDFVKEIDAAISSAWYQSGVAVGTDNDAGSDSEYAWATPVYSLTDSSIELPMVPVPVVASSDVQIVSTATTTIGNQTLICTAALTVTLNATPLDGETVTVKRTNGQVIIDANGKTIDGAATHTMLVDYACINCLYSASQDAWFII